MSGVSDLEIDDRGQHVAVDHIERHLAVVRFRDGRRTPFTVVVFRFGSMPRIETKRPSPWSLSTLTPAMRRAASATFSSGRRSTASADSTEIRPCGGPLAVQRAGQLTALTDDEDIVGDRDVRAQHEIGLDLVIGADQGDGAGLGVRAQIIHHQGEITCRHIAETEGAVTIRRHRLTGFGNPDNGALKTDRSGRFCHTAGNLARLGRPRRKRHHGRRTQQTGHTLHLKIPRHISRRTKMRAGLRAYQQGL
jgi:hypothetical protein